MKSWQDNASSVFVGTYGDLGLASMVDLWRPASLRFVCLTLDHSGLQKPSVNQVFCRTIVGSRFLAKRGLQHNPLFASQPRWPLPTVWNFAHNLPFIFSSSTRTRTWKGKINTLRSLNIPRARCRHFERGLSLSDPTLAQLVGVVRVFHHRVQH